MPSLQKLGLVWRSLPYLKSVQITERIKGKFIKRPVATGPHPELRKFVNPLLRGPRRGPFMLGPETFKFLSVTQEFNAMGGWNGKAPEKLWLLNLHYFDDINGVDSESRHEWHKALIDKWIPGNPVTEGGEGWDPYSVSLRLANWMKWHLRTGELPEAAIQSLAIHARYIETHVEWHLLANHVWTNGKALVLAGAFFGGSEGERWLKEGARILLEEIAEEILDDGGQYERSPMYQAIMLEDLLDVVAFTQALGENAPALLTQVAATCRQTAENMFAWLQIMTHPDGLPALFNDGAIGIAPLLSDLSVYATALGINPGQAPKDGIHHLPTTGYVRMQRGRAVLFVDVSYLGPDYNAAHGHADTLTYELSLDGQRIVVDTGTSVYKQEPWRAVERSTRAHNTVEVAKTNSSEVWSAFRVARRGHPQDVKVEKPSAAAWTVSGAHNGYQKMGLGVLHRRKWILDDAGLTIEDSLEGGSPVADSLIHLHPEVQGETKHLTRGTTIFRVESASPISEEKSWYGENFGTRRDNRRLVLPLANGKGSYKISW